MTKKIILATLLLSLTLFLSCNSTKKSSDKEDEKGVKKEVSEKLEKGVLDFKVTKIMGIDELSRNPTMKIDFEKNKISGNNACNQYGGNIIIKENTIYFERLMSTKMYCKEFNNIEKTFMKMLAATSKFEIKENQIIFYDKNDISLIIGEKHN